MFKNKSKTVAEFLAALPKERRAAVQAVRKVIKANVPKGYKETVAWGALTWEVPLKVYPTTYNGQPLCYVAIGSGKNHASLYLMNTYADPALNTRLRDGFKAAGKKLDMGKACIRFTNADDLALDVVADVVAATPLADYVAGAEHVRTRHSRKKAGA